MGAVDHFKTLCCLGLKPESAMIALAPVLHEIIPHGWSRWALLEPDATIGTSYSENPGTSLYRDRMWRFMDDPTSPMSLWTAVFKATGIGWTLPMQAKGWLDNAWYREIEAPLNSCWFLDAMIGDGRRTIALVNLTRPRNASPFTVDDVQRLDRLRPWLGHAFRRDLLDHACHENDLVAAGGPPVLSGQMVLTPDARIVFQTASLEFLLRRVLEGEPANYTRPVAARERLSPPILKLLRCLGGTASGGADHPPRMRTATAHGIVTLEAKWLMPEGATVEDAAENPQGCLISVMIELREHAIARAARVLRESGATPAQVKVGVRLAMGKAKRVIADELGIQPSSVMDLSKKLYQNLDIHNSAELGMRIWLGEEPGETRQSSLPSWVIETNAAILRKGAAAAGLR